MRQAALVLAPEAPYPLAGGGSLRTASLIEYLSRKYTVDLILFREPGGLDPAASVPPGKVRSVRMIELRRHGKSAPARLLRNVNRAMRGVSPLNDRFSGYRLPLDGSNYALSIVEHFWCAEYFEELSRCCEAVWIDLHNIDSAYYGSLATGAKAPLMRRFAQSARAHERTWLPKFNGVLVASAADANRIADIARASVYPNSIPFVPLQGAPKRNEIVFSGNLEYEPNIQAIRYFNDCIWPLVKRQSPGVRWRLVGRNPGAVSPYLTGDDRIEMTGRVAEAIPEIAAARVSIVPLLSGSGTRVKIIEAWAAGTPVVSTTIGAEGLPCRAGEHLLIAGTPATFANALLEILKSEGLAARLAAAGRSLYEKELTWNAAWGKLSELGL